jgi:ATP-dependent helicase/nuclease subunit A
MTAPAFRIGGVAVEERRFYAAACDPARSVTVEACAGAGKTWMLVSRIVRALLAGVAPQQILAITFTRKAAGEMRERLDHWLQAFAVADDAARSAELQMRGLDAAQAAALAPALGALHERVLAGGRAVEIRTFHGWFAQLLAQAPLAMLQALQLPPRWALVEDPGDLRGELLRAFHRRVDADGALRADYLALVRRHRRATLLDWLDAAWQRRTELLSADAAGTLAGSVPDAAALWPACAGLASPLALLHAAPLRDELDALARALGTRSGAKATHAAQGLRAALDDESDAERAFASAWDALFTAKGAPRKQLGELPAQVAACEQLQLLRTMAAQQAAHEDHGRMVRLVRAWLAEYAALKQRQALIDMDDLERGALALLADPAASGWVQQRLDLQLRQLLIDEFQDTSPLQWQALHAWLAGYAGAGGGASGQRPLAVFIVGDPKQSIYRFRRAEPRVFEAARRFVVDGMDGLALECDHTRRNAPAVIEALNKVFEHARDGQGWGPFRAHSTASTAAGQVVALPRVPRPEARERRGAAAHWRDSLTEPRHEPQALQREPETQQVAQAVAALLRAPGWRPGEVMVLARRRAMLTLVAQQLAAAGVPCVMPEALQLGEAPEALDLVALLDVLASPGHDASLARALKSPLFGVSDSELLALARAALSAPGGRWWPALLRPGAAWTGAPARAAALLRRWAEAAPGLPPHDLLDRIVHEGDLLPRLAAAVPAPRRALALQAVHALLAAALAQDGGRYATPYAFVRALRLRSVKATLAPPADAVQLLTVHGAKGLEARAVFAVDADPELRKPARATLLVDWPVHEVAPRVAAFVHSEAAIAHSLAPLLDSERAEREREELNALYVAMTRARERLVFSATAPHRPQVGPSWWGRVKGVAVAVDATPAVAQAAAQADAEADALAVGAVGAAGSVAAEAVRAPQATAVAVTGAAGAGPGVVPALSGLAAPPLDDRPSGRAPVIIDAPLIWQGTPAAATVPASLEAVAPLATAVLGQALHRALEWIGRPGAALPRAEWPALAGAAAAAFGLAPAHAAELLAALTRVLDSAAAARFFGGPALEWAGNEVPLALDGELLRIDRLVALREGGRRCWWVLDYKLAGAPEAAPELRAQMARYVAAVQAAQPGEPVRAAFVTARGELREV